MSSYLLAHKAALTQGCYLLENIVLDDVAQGFYELIALPLMWMSVEASPVRAILRPIVRPSC